MNMRDMHLQACITAAARADALGNAVLAAMFRRDVLLLVIKAKPLAPLHLREALTATPHAVKHGDIAA
jgi:hypothetical protein